MARAALLPFVRVFRFSLNKEFESLGLSSLHWEGPHLVLTRAISRGRPSLFEELLGFSLRVQLIDHEDASVKREWRLAFETMKDRGFLFLNAEKGDVAREAVCLVNAELTLVKRDERRPASDFACRGRVARGRVVMFDPVRAVAEVSFLDASFATFPTTCFRVRPTRFPESGEEVGRSAGVPIWW